VLEQDDVDVQAAEQPGRANIVAADRLRDGGEDVGQLRAGGLVDDDDQADVVDAGRFE
jgi:hypothetical protein